MARINFEAQSDRDLLVMTAQTVNDISEHLVKINGTLLKHETRLGKLEGRPACMPTKSPVTRFVDAVGKGGAFVILGSILAGIVIALAEHFGWW